MSAFRSQNFLPTVTKMATSDGINVLIAGQTGVGKSSIINMIMDASDGSSGAARVSNEPRPCTMETTSYVAPLEGTQCRLWDTPGHDEAVDNTGILPKLREQLGRSGPDRELKTTCRKLIKQAAPAILVWCIAASKIDVSVQWQQFRKVYVDYCQKKVKPVVVLTRMLEKSSNEWESRCRLQLQRLGPDISLDDVFLFRVRKYRGPGAPEYTEDSQDLRELISLVSGVRVEKSVVIPPVLPVEESIPEPPVSAEHQELRKSLISAYLMLI